MNQNAEFRYLYDEVGNDPHAWMRKALALFTSAEILKTSHYDNSADTSDETVAFHRMNMQQVFVMLRGMGIECLLKAAWVQKVEAVAVEGKFQKPISANPHDLVLLEKALDERIGTGLSQEERMVLARLSMQIVAGRYPIGTRVKQSPALPPGSGSPYFMRWIDEDEQLFQSISAKLSNIVNNS